ncbi:MAG: hypothetical protein LBB23_03320 [Rickettsiales bacterium]|jgi:glutaredoxin|nr:hypothetical protein [Rickettsiales bacterium]
MKKILLFAFAILALPAVAAKDATLFYMTTCPHCHHAMEFIDETLVIEYPFVQFNKKNVGEPSNRGAFERQIKKCKLDSFGVPLMVIGDKCFQGFGKGTTEKEYRDALNDGLNEIETESVAANSARLAANPVAVRKENAERTARAKAEKVVIEKQNGYGYLYVILGVLGVLLLVVLAMPKRKKK